METNKNTQTPEEIPSLIDTETPSTSNHKLKYIVIGALILMLGLAGGIYYSRIFLQSPDTESVQNTPAVSQTISPSQESDEMDGWKKYTHAGFSISFPNDWYVHDLAISDEDWGNQVFFAGPDLKSIPKGRQFSALRISYEESVEPFDFSSYKEFIESDKGYNMKGYLDHRIVEIGDIKAFQSEFKDNTNLSLPPFISTSMYIGGRLINIVMEAEVNEGDYTIYNKILSTFEFTDIEAKNTTPIPTSNPQITQSTQTITHTPITGWETYSNSFNGLTFQYPSGFRPVSEAKIDLACIFTFSNDVGGVLQGNIAPYDGGSRRVHYGTYFDLGPGYTYTFEDVYIQGVKALIVETGPIGDSGTGTAVIIPKGKYALILHISNRGKDDETFQNILKSISIINLSGGCA